MAMQGKDTGKDLWKGLKERFKKSGFEGFSDREIIEFLLFSSGAKGDIASMSEALFRAFRSLKGIFNATPEELSLAAGLSEKASSVICAVRFAAGAFLKDRVAGRDVIRGKKDLLDYLKVNLSEEMMERFLGVYLNSRNEAIAIETLHEGTVDSTTVYPRKAIELAFKYSASSVIFVHNHPSGKTAPSHSDIHLIRALDRAALAVGLIAHDHLIIAANKHFSARENGWIIGYPCLFTRAAET